MLSACSLTSTTIDSVGNAAKNTGLGVGAAKVGEGIKQLGQSKVEAQKSQQKITEKNTKKTEKIARVISQISNEKDRAVLAKQALLSNEKIELAREKTKQVQAQNGGYAKYAFGSAIGVVFSALALMLFAIGRNTKFSIGK